MARIKEGRKFQDAILKQRDLVVGSDEDRRTQSRPELSLVAGDVMVGLLKEMAGSLHRIEKSLSQKTG